jgi:aryl-alcohol dehydrogenase-like predicted oxidoreductase
VLDALDAVSGETGEPLATVALAWIMAQPGITAALASATSLDQLAELTAAMDLKLSAGQLSRLDTASAEVEPAISG